MKVVTENVRRLPHAAASTSTIVSRSCTRTSSLQSGRMHAVTQFVGA